MKTIDWEVCLLRAPAAVRHCKRCGGDGVFQPSGQFRVNAQQKYLDIWLIYKCRACGATWNLEVLSRVGPGSLPPGRLNQYTNNDGELALCHATDAALVKRGGARPCAAEVDIAGPDYDWTEAAEVHLRTRRPLENKAAALVRLKLGVSRAAFERLCAQGKIICLSGQNLEKCKLGGEIVFRIFP